MTPPITPREGLEDRLPTHGNLLADINKAAHAAGTNAWVRDVLKRAHRAIRQNAPLAAPVQSAWQPIETAPMPVKRLLARVASLICETTCGLTSECRSREAAQALLDGGYLTPSVDTSKSTDPARNNRFCAHDDCPWPECLVGGVCPSQPFYGAQCPSYPNCNGGCGLGCTHDITPARGDTK
jgi:hypothetical protein